MKKILSIILCLAMILSLAVMASAAESYATTPKTGTAYKLGLHQDNLNKQLYFNGATKEGYSYYFATTTEYDEAVDVYVESVTGGYRLYFKDGSTKTYIDIYKSGTHINLRMTTSPSATYIWNEEYDTFTTTVDGTDYYIGTYNSFDTMSASKVDFISSSFPSHLYTKEEEVETPDPDPVDEYVTSAAANVTYKLGSYQTNLGKQLYFNGTTANKDYYFSTGTIEEAVDVKLEPVTGGYRMYFTSEGAKTYIDIYQNGDYVNLRMTDEPTAVYTWNEKYDTLTTEVGGTEYYIGTYGTYNTLSASKIDYIETSFPSHLYATKSTGGDDTTTGGDKEDDKEDNKDEKPTTKPTEPAKPVEYHGTKLSKLSDGDTVLIYSVANSSVMTTKENVYEGATYTKTQLEQLEVSVKNNVVTYGKGAVVLTVHINDGKVSFTTPDGKYLYADGTNVKFVAEAGENTEFVLEETTDGYFIKCANATYDDKAQYLEIYKGYFTCYGKYEDSDASLYTFQFFEADPDTSAKTGDAVSVIAALLLVSAAGIAVIGKKKEF